MRKNMYLGGTYMAESKSKFSNWYKTGMFGYIPVKYFFPFLILVSISVFIDSAPGGFLGGFVICSCFGLLLLKLGDNIPIIRSFLGGGSFLTIFGAAFIAYFKVFPDGTAELLSNFVKNMDAIGWAALAVICGSILTMDRNLLIHAGKLYFIPIIAGIIVAFGFAGIAGQLLGYGWREAILYVALPIMGGGTSAGAVPMSQSYGAILSQDPGYYLSLMMPAVVIGNAVAIVSAGILKSIGQRFPKFTGNGKMMRSKMDQVSEDEKEYLKHPIQIETLGRGFVLTGVLLAAGMLFYKLVPSIHFYAWTILICAVCKIFGLIPKGLEIDVGHWYQFSLKLTVPVSMFAIGYVYTDLNVVISNFSIAFFLLVLATVFGAIVGTWIAGNLLGFYPIEASITAGLCMANMGGSGDVATLGAADRMGLMPFASISSRLGGALIIIIAGLLLPLIGGGL